MSITNYWNFPDIIGMDEFVNAVCKEINDMQDGSVGTDQTFGIIRVKDLDATPTGDILIKNLDQVLYFRDGDDANYISIRTRLINEVAGTFDGRDVSEDLVKVEGDTMTGDLLISKATPKLNLYGTSGNSILEFGDDAGGGGTIRKVYGDPSLKIDVFLELENGLTVEGDILTVIEGIESEEDILMSAGKTVDGRDLSADGAWLDTLYTTIGLSALTSAEVDQLENIGTTTISAAQWGYLGACGAGGGQLLAALTTVESTQLEAIGTTTISATQWGYLGAMNQGVATTDSPTLVALTLSGLTLGSVLFGGASGLISQDNSNLFWDDTNNRLSIGINSGLDPRIGLSILGDLDVIHTATEADDHALELDVNAAALGDVKAIDVNYITGAIDTGQDEGVILINIDEIQADGGEIFGLEVLATEGAVASTVTVHGLKAGVGVGPVHQDVGTFDDATMLATDNTINTNVPFMIDGIIGNTTDIFDLVNYFIILGDDAPFQELEIVLDTGASGGGIKPKFEYSRAGAGLWTEFTPVDGTNGFRNTGIIAWDASDVAAPAHGINTDTGNYDIRIERIRNSLSTIPVLGYAKVASTTEYEWDKDGDISIHDLDVLGEIDPTSYVTGRGGFKDEDTMVSDSATAVVSQQSIKAYVDTRAGVDMDTLVVKLNVANPTYQVDVDAVKLQVGPYNLSTVNLTIDIEDSGDNGLEASDTEGANKWYEVYVGVEADLTVIGFLNESGTAIDTDPTGTGIYRQVGHVRNGATSNLNDNYMAAESWGDDFHVRPGPSAPTRDFIASDFTHDSAQHVDGLDLSAVVAPGATGVWMLLYIRSTGAATIFAIRRNATNTYQRLELVAQVANQLSSGIPSLVSCDSDRLYDYFSSLTGVDGATRYVRLIILGWTR